jgi:hypothetical protein
LNVFIAFSTVDRGGQIEDGFALEVRSLTLAGITDQGIQFDIHHQDGETERLALGGTPYRNLSMGRIRDRIMRVRVIGEYPAMPLISKAEFRARVGVGKLLNERGHFV